MTGHREYEYQHGAEVDSDDELRWKAGLSRPTIVCGRTLSVGGAAAAAAGSRRGGIWIEKLIGKQAARIENATQTVQLSRAV